MIATPANLAPPAVDPDLVAAVRRLAAWAGRPCTDAEAAEALRDVLAFDPDQPRVPAGQPGGGEFGSGGGGGDAAKTPREQAGERAALERKHGQEWAAVNRTREREDRATARKREKEDDRTDARREREDRPEARQAEREFAPAFREMGQRHEREKADEATRFRERAALVRREESRARELAAPKWPGRDAEDRATRERREREDAATAAARRAEDAALAERQTREEDALREAHARGASAGVGLPGVRAYSPDQPRDEAGRFGEGGAGGTGKEGHGGAADVDRWKREAGFDRQSRDPEHNHANAALPDATRPHFTKDEMDAVHAYSWRGDGPMNRALRSGEPLTPQSQQLRDNLDRMFDKAGKLDPPVTVIRRVNFEGANKVAFIKAVQQSRGTGAAWVHNGYASTTTDPTNLFGGNITMEIHATHGLDMKPYSNRPKEDELLLPHRSMFSIKEVNMVGPGHYHVVMHQLPGRAPGEPKVAEKKSWLGKIKEALGAAAPAKDDTPRPSDKFPEPDRFIGDGSEWELLPAPPAGQKPEGGGG